MYVVIIINVIKIIRCILKIINLNWGIKYNDKCKWSFLQLSQMIEREHCEIFTYIYGEYIFDTIKQNVRFQRTSHL